MLFNIATRTKPILKWAGGKSSLLAQLIPLFPNKFQRYIEPFCGGGAVFFALDTNLGLPSFINDISKDLYSLYLTIRDQPFDLMRALDYLHTQYSEEFYYQVRAYAPETTLDIAARTVFLNKTGFNGLYRLNSKDKFNVPFGKRTHCPKLYDEKHLLEASVRLKHASILNLDFETLLTDSKAGDFIYCDPPYEPLSATSSFNSYHGIPFSMSEQVRLFEACLKASTRGAFVAISNSSSPKILDLYKKNITHKIYARRSINTKGNQRGPIEEVLLTLY
ncbi:MAG: Dam family site-specific DNA-(adenine-N6)-methyltransferase [Silvanigrellaceae bacterium]|nr:Dam family site-specific DNA-(adenine-N6)-methyltransferase [Silvanigrellaceae bacterium]